MNKKLKEILDNSSFEIQPGFYIYSKVSIYPLNHDHFMISQDNEEITVVTKIERLKELEIIERNKGEYVLIMLNVSVPFYSVGFLASVSHVIAKKGLNLLIVSTYSKDYIMIRKEHLEKSHQALIELGLTEKIL